jgi:hypothetical protein
MVQETNRTKVASKILLRLSSAEILKPLCVIESFYSSYDLEDVGRLLWQMTSTTICLDDEKL